MKVLTYTGKVMNHVHADLGKLLGRADAGAEQDFSGSHRPRCQHDFTGVKDALFAALLNLNTRDHAIVDHNAENLDLSDDRQILVVLDGLKVDLPSREALRAAHGELSGGNAVQFTYVVVRVAGEAPLLRGIHDGALDGVHVEVVDHVKETVSAAAASVSAVVVLNLFKDGSDIIPSPSRTSQVFPRVVVAGVAPVNIRGCESRSWCGSEPVVIYVNGVGESHLWRVGEPPWLGSFRRVDWSRDERSMYPWYERLSRS